MILMSFWNNVTAKGLCLRNVAILVQNQIYTHAVITLGVQHSRGTRGMILQYGLVPTMVLRAELLLSTAA